MSWQLKLKNQVKSLSNEEVTVLRLSNLKFNKIPEDFGKELQKYPNLTKLSLNDCAIRSIDNLPQIDSLNHLEMLDNFTTSNTIKSIVQKFKNLETLILGGNILRQESDLDALKELKFLKELNIINGINKPDSVIRSYCFNLIPSLQYLDDRDKNGKIKEKQNEKQQINTDQRKQNEMEEEQENENDQTLSSDDESNIEQSDSDHSDEDEDGEFDDFIEKKIKQ